MITMKGGTGATLVAVFLAATFAGGVSISGLTSTFTNAFQSINFQSDIDFLKNFIAPNVKAGCRTRNSLAKFPQTTNMSKKLSSIEALRIKQKNTLFGAGDKILSLQVRTNGGSKKSIRLDFNGLINSDWNCEGANGGGSEKIRINYTDVIDGTSGEKSKGSWLDISGDTITHFRILEDTTDGKNKTEDLKIQVYITRG
ncbi:MAG: hypothetical protein ABEK10_02960 [Candidatus Nanosalina sp.]